MDESILVPISAASYKQGHSEMYGVIELDISGQKVWEFNAEESELELAQLVETGGGMEQEGFRPTSVQRLDNGLTLISGWKLAVWVDEDGDICRTETHDHMNDCHEIQKTKDNTYLVSSTGMDIILEFTENWKLKKEWKMWEHIEVDLPNNYYPPIVYGSDTRFIAGMPDHRFHLNYATLTESGNILASALNYGLMLIDRWNDNILWSFTDISECHNPTELEGEYIVCESGENRIVRVNPIENTIEEFMDWNFNFPKDCDYVPHRDSWLITDTRNNKIHLINDEDASEIRTFHLPEKSCPYEADFLTGSDSNV